MSSQAAPREPSHNFPSGTDVLTPEQIRCLEEDAIFPPQPQSQSGKRKVSAAFSMSRYVSSTSSASSVSVETEGFESNIMRTFDIPLVEESIEVLEFIGFSANTARVLYDRYLDRPDPHQNPDDLMAYVSSHLAYLNSPNDDTISPAEALQDAGLNLQIQQAITDPRFSSIFGTQSLYYWANDTVETNYGALLSRQTVLRNHANQRIEHKKKHKRPRQALDLSHGQEPSQQLAITASINMTPSDFQFPEGHVIMKTTDADILDDHISLYKGKSFQDLYNTEIIDGDGSINFSALRTNPGGDFNSIELAYYWSPEKETAEYYRKYAAIRSPHADTCIIHIQLSRSFMNNLHQEELWYSRDWKEYIWTCRKMRKPSSNFNRFFQHADVVKGHIYSTTSRQVTHLKEEEVQTHLSENNVMQLDSGRKATEWVFYHHHNTISRLAEEIRGKTHFVITEATAVDRAFR